MWCRCNLQIGWENQKCDSRWSHSRPFAISTPRSSTRTCKEIADWLGVHQGHWADEPKSDGTAVLFEAAASNGHKRVVFSSSLFAMGYSHDPSAFKPSYLPLDEQHPVHPLEHYGISKAFGEEFAAMLTRAPGDSSSDPPQKRPRSDSLSFVSLRFSNIIKEENFSQLPLSWKLRPFPVTPLMWAYCHEHDVVWTRTSKPWCFTGRPLPPGWLSNRGRWLPSNMMPQIDLSMIISNLQMSWRVKIC